MLQQTEDIPQISSQVQLEAEDNKDSSYQVHDTDHGDYLLCNVSNVFAIIFKCYFVPGSSETIWEFCSYKI